MICLADNDIILKLACCDLLAEAMEAWESAPDDVYVLGSAVHKLLRPNDPTKALVKPSEPEYARLRAFFGAVRIIMAVPPPEEIVAFDDALKIDPGEAILFAATAEYPEAIVATGDKKSLASLAGAQNEICARVCERMAGRCSCFEQTMLKVIDGIGFDIVLERVVPARHCDIALRSIFGSGIHARESGVRDGLHSYIGDLRKQTGGLLME